MASTHNYAPLTDHELDSLDDRADAWREFGKAEEWLEHHKQRHAESTGEPVAFARLADILSTGTHPHDLVEAVLGSDKPIVPPHRVREMVRIAAWNEYCKSTWGARRNKWMAIFLAACMEA